MSILATFVKIVYQPQHSHRKQAESSGKHIIIFVTCHSSIYKILSYARLDRKPFFKYIQNKKGKIHKTEQYQVTM